jgi:hypothetical protein
LWCGSKDVLDFAEEEDESEAESEAESGDGVESAGVGEEKEDEDAEVAVAAKPKGKEQVLLTRQKLAEWSTQLKVSVAALVLYHFVRQMNRLKVDILLLL